MNSKVNGEKNKYIIRYMKLEIGRNWVTCGDAFVPLNSRIKKIILT